MIYHDLTRGNPTAFERLLLQMLGEKGILTEAVKRDWVAKAASSGASILEVLFANGIVTRASLHAILSEEDSRLIARMGERSTLNSLLSKIALEMDIPPIDLQRLDPNAEALAALPRELAERFNCFPVAVIDNLLTVAVWNPFDILAIDDIRVLTHLEIRPVVSSLAAIRAAIERAYAD